VAFYAAGRNPQKLVHERGWSRWLADARQARQQGQAFSNLRHCVTVSEWKACQVKGIQTLLGRPARRGRPTLPFAAV
jgi:hypothetical protein